MDAPPRAWPVWTDDRCQSPAERSTPSRAAWPLKRRTFEAAAGRRTLDRYQGSNSWPSTRRTRPYLAPPQAVPGRRRRHIRGYRSQIESGARSPDSRSLLVALAQALDVAVADLLGRTSYPTDPVRVQAPAPPRHRELLRSVAFSPSARPGEGLSAPGVAVPKEPVGPLCPDRRDRAIFASRTPTGSPCQQRPPVAPAEASDSRRGLSRRACPRIARRDSLPSVTEGIAGTSS